MMDWQHQESPASSTFCDDGKEAWVDGAQLVVVDTPCDWHAIVAVLFGGGLTEHMAELGAAVLRTPCHLGEKGREKQDGW